MSRDKILKKRRNEDFKTIYLKILQDEPKLTWKAKGLHTYLISRPQNWEFNYTDLIDRSQDGRTAIKNAIDELKESGYLKIERTREEDTGKFKEVKWIVAEEPSMLTEDLPNADNPNEGNPSKDNRTNSSCSNNSKKKESNNKYNDELDITKKDNGLYDYPKDFENVWSEYPYQRGTKKATWEKWRNKRKDGVDNNLLLQSAKNYNKKVQQQDREEKYVKRAETFFGPKDHWQDFVDENFELSNKSKDKDYVKTLN